MKKLGFIIILPLLLILGYFWVGIYEDPEFFNYGSFIKKRPCPKFFFSSPIGMGDIGDRNLSEQEQFEEYMFEQYLYGVGKIQSKSFSFKMCDMDVKNWKYYEVYNPVKVPESIALPPKSL